MWIPGVRIESASFSLTQPALLNAVTTAVAQGRQQDVVALVLSRPFQRGEAAYASDLPGGPWEAFAPDVWTSRPGRSLPTPTRPVDPSVRPAQVSAAGGENHAGQQAAGISAARQVAERAYVPASSYPVGAVLEIEDGPFLPGVNVEHPDWTRILCAERNAVGTAYAYGQPDVRRLFLSCLNDPEGTPCGACRQVLAELTPEATLWMDRHSDAPQRTTASALLPGFFRGRALLS